jgi:HAD superfamily hydrolase (TIGR01509 family)
VTTTFAVGFDFDHTLALDHGLERKAFERLADELGVPDALSAPRVQQAVDDLLRQFRADEMTLEAAVDGFVTGILAASGGRSPTPPAEHYRAICYSLVDELVKPIDGAAEVLAALAADGVPVAILTNGWSPLQQRKIARALGRFDGTVLVSDEIGSLKPERHAFDRLAGALAREPAAIWYVGDNPDVDVAGAQAAGMRAVWFDWEGHAYPSALAPPAARIANLHEILPLVRGS